MLRVCLCLQTTKVLLNPFIPTPNDYINVNFWFSMEFIFSLELKRPLDKRKEFPKMASTLFSDHLVFEGKGFNTKSTQLQLLINH